MGLTVDVYRNADRNGDCTNNGASRRFSKLTLINCEGPFDPDESAPAAILEKTRQGVLRVRPLETGDRWVMFGGNYAATSDSRFGQKCAELLGRDFYGAVAIHDRVE